MCYSYIGVVGLANEHDRMKVLLFTEWFYLQRQLSKK